WLVFRREISKGIRAKSWLAGISVIIVVLVGYVLLAHNMAYKANNVTVGLSGQASGLAGPLQSSAAALGDTVHIVQIAKASDGVAQVRSSTLDVLVAGAPGALQVTVQNQIDPRLSAALNGLVQQQALDAEL